MIVEETRHIVFLTQVQSLHDKLLILVPNTTLQCSENQVSMSCGLFQFNDDDDDDDVSSV